MKNTLCWMNMGSPDVEGSYEFYEQMFDWNMHKRHYGEKSMIEIDAGERSFAGISDTEAGEMPMWTPFVMVENVQEFIDKAESLGATIIYPRTQIDGGGAYAVFIDPQGAALGVYEPSAQEVAAMLG